MAFAEDFSVFFNAAEFAEAATYTPAGGDPASGTVIFDENGALPSDDYGVDTMSPTAVCPREQWPNAAEGDGLEIAFATGTRSYKIRGATPVGDGRIVMLTLVRL